MNFLKRLFSKNSDTKSVQQNMDRVFGSTDDEIKQFFADWGQITFGDKIIKINNYPFEPAVVYKQKTIEATEISNIDIESAPPTIQIANELIFISAEHREALKRFADKNKIDIIKHPFIWNWILEPFLDTNFTPEHKERLDKLLAVYGLIPAQISAIRDEVKEQMLKYNFDTMLWNWTDFNAMDVLLAMRPKYAADKFSEFYKEVMNIALLPPLTGTHSY